MLAAKTVSKNYSRDSMQTDHGRINVFIFDNVQCKMQTVGRSTRKKQSVVSIESSNTTVR